MAEETQNPHFSHAIHGRLLDRRLRPSGRGWLRSASGECPGDEESAGTEQRRAGEPMADEAAPLWVSAKLVSAIAGDSNDEDVLEAKE